MFQPSENRKALQNRFIMTMGRIGAIAMFLQSGSEGIKQTGFARSDGVQADILRAVVVFLHATIEDFVRSQSLKPNKRFAFYSVSDIKRALHRLEVDPALFTDLFPPLTQMAERRNRIVHHADLHDILSQEINPWGIADQWQLIHWHLAVSAFHYRLRRATGPTNLVEDRASQNVESALLQNIAFARALMAFPSLSAEQHLGELKRLSEFLENILKTLRLEVEMFIGPDGKIIDGAVPTKAP
jgi:hypothetical protein